MLVILILCLNLHAQTVVIDQKKEQVELQVEENPSTGHLWFLSDWSPNILEPIYSEFMPPQSNRIGAPGIRKFVFRAKAYTHVPVATQVKLVLLSPDRRVSREKQVWVIAHE